MNLSKLPVAFCVHKLFSKRSKKVKDALLTFETGVLYYDQKEKSKKVKVKKRF